MTGRLNGEMTWHDERAMTTVVMKLAVVKDSLNEVAVGRIRLDLTNGTPASMHRRGFSIGGLIRNGAF
jgi:hypothetical protein